MREGCVSKHITTNVKTVFTDKSAYLEQIVYCVSDIGSGGWLFTVEDRGDTLTPPVPVQTLVKVVLATTTTPEQQKVFYDRPIPMRGGVTVTTSTGTAGKLDVFITGWGTEEEG